MLFWMLVGQRLNALFYQGASARAYFKCQGSLAQFGGLKKNPELFLNPMLKRIVSFLSVWVLSAALLSADEKADAVLEKYIDFLGGKDRIEELVTLQMTVVTAMPRGGMKVTSRMSFKEGYKLLVDQTLTNGMEIRTVYNNGEGYYEEFSGRRKLTADEKEGSLLKSDIQAVLRYKDYYKSIIYKMSGTVDGEAVDILSFVNQKDEEELWYFDSEGALVRKERKIPMGQVGDIDGAEIYKEYQEVDGYRFPKVIQVDLGAIGHTMEVQDIKVNEPLDDWLFTLEQKDEDLFKF